MQREVNNIVLCALRCVPMNAAKQRSDHVSYRCFIFLQIDQSDSTGIRLTCLRSLLSAVQQSLHHGFNRGAISHIADANKPDKLSLF